MSRRPRQQGHGRAKQQREDNQHAHRIKCISVAHAADAESTSTTTTTGSGGVGVGGCFSVSRRAGEPVHSNYRNNKQAEDYKSDEDINEFVDARGAVERNMWIRSLGLKFGGSEVFL